MKRASLFLAVLPLTGCSLFDLWKEPAIDFAERACVTDAECAGLSFTLNAELEQIRAENSCVVFAPFCNTDRGRCDVSVSTRDLDGDGARARDPGEVVGDYDAEDPADPSTDCRDSPFEPHVPDCDDDSPAVTPFDNDGDGRVGLCVVGGTDCDDSNAAIYPGAENICDGWINDCDIELEEDQTRRVLAEDVDGDGYGVDDGLCNALAVGVELDCDDTEPTVHPGALEICDGVVNDCRRPDGGEYAMTEDSDGDGFAAATVSSTVCTRVATIPADCEPENASTYPGAPEICDGFFNDCLAGTGTRIEESDGDGFYPYEGICQLGPRQLGECATADFDDTLRFCLPAEQPPIADFSNPTHIAFGDLDGDGLPDIVVIDGGVLKTFYTQEDGTFEAGATDSGYAGVTGIALVPFDGDDDVDIVVTDDGSDSFRAVYNNGATVDLFTDATLSPGVEGVTSLVVEDFDKDGVLEGAFAVPGDDDVIIQEFGAATVTVEASFTGVSTIAAVDLDGDEYLDLVGATPSSSVVRRWINPAAGLGAWTAAPDLTVADGIGAIGGGDLDADGDGDIVVAASDGLLALVQEDGAFVTEVVDASFPGSESVRVVDVDRDGRAEIVAAIGDADTLAYYELEGGEWIVHDIATDLSLVTALHVGDADGDGDADLGAVATNAGIATWWRSAFAGAIDWERRAVDRAFGSADKLAVGDVDGDGALDVVGASSQEVVTWRNQSRDGSRWAESQVAPIDSIVQLLAADLDLDGASEILAVGQPDGAAEQSAIWWTREGPAGGAPSFDETIFEASAGARAVAVGDVNIDGAPDVLVATATEVILYTNGATSPPAFTRSVAQGGFTSIAGLATGDFAGDTGIDFAVAADGEIALFESTAAGFVAGPTVSGIAATGMLVSGHFGTDAREDLVFSSSMGALLVVNVSNDGLLSAVRTDPGVGAAERIRVGDLDRDGDADILGVQGDFLLWWENTEPSAPHRWVAHVADDTISVGGDVEIGDLDGDRFNDALATNLGTNRVSWYRNDGAAWWNP